MIHNHFTQFSIAVAKAQSGTTVLNDMTVTFLEMIYRQTTFGENISSFLVDIYSDGLSIKVFV